MLEIATAILALVSALIFAIHAMDAYAQVEADKRAARRAVPSRHEGQWPASLLLRERGQNAGAGRLNNGSSPQSTARKRLKFL
jgi:hypothetical protein